MVCTDYYRIDAGGKVCGYTSNEFTCYLVRTETARAVGAFRPEYMLVEDADFLIRLKHAHGEPPRIRSPHFKYRVHTNNLSAKRIAQRQVVSVKMHYDLIARGIEKGDLRSLFRDRLSVAAFYRGDDAIAQILAFAEEKAPELAPRLRRYARFLARPLGRVLNRVRIAYVTRRGRVKAWVARLRS